MPFVAINLALGPLVPLSYVWSARRWPEYVGAAWGDLPEAWKLPYTGNMFLAAAGYLAFTWFFLRHATDATLRAMCVAYVVILLPSMVWMPLTLYALATGSALEWLIQLVLVAVALGSFGVLHRVAVSDSPAPSLRWARAGAVAFCVQTVLLDALVWPRFFSVS